jgi:hypothetical protein
LSIHIVVVPAAKFWRDWFTFAFAQHVIYVGVNIYITDIAYVFEPIYSDTDGM